MYSVVYDKYSHLFFSLYDRIAFPNTIRLRTSSSNDCLYDLPNVGVRTRFVLARVGFGGRCHQYLYLFSFLSRYCRVIQASLPSHLIYVIDRAVHWSRKSDPKVPHDLINTKIVPIFVHTHGVISQLLQSKHENIVLNISLFV